MSATAATEQATTSLFASLLPNYLALEGILLETAVLASTLILESTADYERLRLYNVALVVSPPTASIIFLPLRLPVIGEAVDFNYIGSSNHAFFLLRGAPGQHFTYAAFIGYSGGPPDTPLAPGCLVKVPTPGMFLVAMGDWLITANAMMAPATGSGKRSREALQEEIGVQTPTATGEVAVKTYLEDLDGGRRNCRDMSKSARREVELGPVWRLTLGRELDIAGRGHVLQASEYLQAIWAAALDPSLDTTGHYQDAPLILHIADLAIAKDKTALSAFVQAKFGVYGDLGLQVFGSGGATLKDMPTLKGRRSISDSLDILSIAMRVFYSPAFAGCMAPLKETLTGSSDPLKLVPDDLLQHSIDICLGRWGKTVRSESRSAAFPDIVLSNPTGCATLLTSMLAATVASLAGDNVVRQDLHFRTYIKPTLKLVPMIRTEKVVAAKATPEMICSYHILKQLKVVTGKGNLISCSKGKDCPKRHLLLSKLSDTTVRATIDKLPDAVRVIALAHLDKSKK